MVVKFECVLKIWWTLRLFINLRQLTNNVSRVSCTFIITWKKCQWIVAWYRLSVCCRVEILKANGKGITCACGSSIRMFAQFFREKIPLVSMVAQHLCTSQIEASTSPPGQSPGHLNFWKIFVQILPSRGRKAVQMPHHRSIPGDQMPPPPGNFSVSFIMLRKLRM